MTAELCHHRPHTRKVFRKLSPAGLGAAGVLCPHMSALGKKAVAGEDGLPAFPGALLSTGLCTFSLLS